MTNKLWACLLMLGAVAPLTAAGDESSLVKFNGGIGVIPVSSGVGTAATATTVNRNIVRTVQPPGQPWVIRALRADVKVDGLDVRIKVKGKGLLLAGNAPGTNGNQRVFATLICEANAPFTLRNTNLNGVPLQPDGDFQIDDVLTPRPVDCASPVLLIRNVAAGAWFAAGIPKLDGDDD